MIFKSGMDQGQFDDFVSKIDTKHETIGITDKGLAQRLAKLYSDIYCDVNNGAYLFENAIPNSFVADFALTIGCANMY